MRKTCTLLYYLNFVKKKSVESDNREKFWVLTKISKPLFSNKYNCSCKRVTKNWADQFWPPFSLNLQSLIFS